MLQHILQHMPTLHEHTGDACNPRKCATSSVCLCALARGAQQLQAEEGALGTPPPLHLPFTLPRPRLTLQHMLQHMLQHILQHMLTLLEHTGGVCRSTLDMSLPL